MDPISSIPLVFAFLAGLISFLSPCVLPLIPSYLSVVSGVSYQELSRAGTRDWRLRWRVLLSSLLFIVGFSAVFVLLGASISAVTQGLMGFRREVTFLGGIFIIFFGLFTAGFLHIGFLKRYFQPLESKLKGRTAGGLGAFLVGVSFGVGWTPCVGPTLGAILTLAAVKGGKGAWLLMVYSAGLAVPFLLAAVAFNGFLGFFQRFKRLLPTVQRVGGVILILMGVLLLTGQFTVLNTYALSLTPEWLWERL
ncbi:MAG: cytochrome c biogenesis CcdA family protein [Nitrospinota bacterium]